ncbi:unannotated protein [freshwater metagenome]|uniref:Unannotated protein n=1 Tax=freshwater metagenome TaxID=449393 RepID=A0A6J7C770_9ZZZZ
MQYPFLQRGLEIDQRIAESDQVDPRESRVELHVVTGENQTIAQILSDLPASLGALEPAVPAIFGDGLHRIVAVPAAAGDLERGFGDIGGEHLQAAAQARGVIDDVGREHCHGVGLFAGGATWNPYAQLRCGLESL